MRYLLLSLLLAAGPASANCVTDNIGRVWCSMYSNGGAMKDNIGQVKCGKGQCAKDSIGQVKCARDEGGGAATNNIGQVKCSGGCENGTKSYCKQAR
jgi:hypothetical protein